MRNLKTMLSSVKMDWETPMEVYNPLDLEFGFTLDFCATNENKKHNHFYSEEQNALLQNPIGEIIFCNPPYGNKIKDFVKKCSELSINNTIVMLIPARTDTLYFHKYIYNKAEIRFVKGRIKFIGNQKGSGSAPFPSMIVIFKNKAELESEGKETECDCKMFIGGSGELCPDCKKEIANKRIKQNDKVSKFTHDLMNTEYEEISK